MSEAQYSTNAVDAFVKPEGRKIAKETTSPTDDNGSEGGPYIPRVLCVSGIEGGKSVEKGMSSPKLYRQSESELPIRRSAEDLSPASQHGRLDPEHSAGQRESRA